MNCKSTGALAQGDCFNKITTYMATGGFDRVDLETVQGKKLNIIFNSNWANTSPFTSTLGGSATSKSCLTGLYGYTLSD